LPSRDHYVFGCFELEIPTCSLYKSGRRIAAAPKVVLVLALLIERGGQCVSTDDILDRLSGSGEIGVANVAQYVAVIRKILGDDSRRPKFIATEYGRGYRFIASVQRRAESEPPGATELALYQARYHLDRLHPRDLRIALGQFNRICVRKPKDPRGLVGMAEVNSALASYFLDSPVQRFATASRLALSTLAIDRYAARAHSVLAHVALFSDHDLDQAVRHCADALMLDPDDALAIRVSSRVSMVQRNWSGARRHLMRDLAIRPYSLDALTMLGVIEQYERRPDSAANFLSRIAELDPTFTQSRYHLSTCLVEAGRAVEAVGILRDLARRDPSQHIVAALGRALANVGKKAAAKRILALLQHRAANEYVSPYIVSGLHLALGEGREARARMVEAQRNHDPWSIFYSVEPRFDSIRL